MGELSRRRPRCSPIVRTRCTGSKQFGSKFVVVVVVVARIFGVQVFLLCFDVDTIHNGKHTHTPENEESCCSKER